MKRFLPIVIALIVLLTACSKTNNEKLSSTPSPTPTPSVGPELTAMNKVVSEDGTPAIGVLLSDYISAIDPWITEDGYKSLTNYNDSAYEFGTDKAYTICPAPGLFINIYTSIKTEEINQLVYWLDLNTADANTKKAFQDIVKETVYGLDFETADSILTNLDFNNSSEEIENICDSDIETYIYSVDSKSIKFYVLPKQTN